MIEMKINAFALKPGLIAGPGIQTVGLGPLGTAIIGNKRGRGGGAVADVKPFDVTVALDTEAPDPETADRLVTLRTGVVNNRLPTNIFGEASVAPIGTRYVVLNVTVVAGAISGSSISIDTAAPDPYPVSADVPSSTLAILIAVIVDASVFQVLRGNITVTPTAAFFTTPAVPPLPGESAYRYYWTYTVTAS